jgi:uncharacterized protein YbcI
MVVMGDTMTTGERQLAEHGKAKSPAYEGRGTGDHARRACAEVERVMGRKIIAFMSDNHVEPDMGVEVFVPRARDGLAARTYRGSVSPRVAIEG